MKRHHLLAVYLSILAAWMQFIVPVAMANVRADADPFSIICSHPPVDSKDGSQPLHRSADHDCCTLCHAQLGALAAIDDRPVFTFFDYPVASPLRWRLAAAPPIAAPNPSQHRPRGPPSLV